MFDVSWIDPARETVGQRRSRKDQQNGSSRPPSLRISRSPEPSSVLSEANFLGFFGSSKKPATPRSTSGSQSRSSALRPPPLLKTSRRNSSYTISSEPSFDHPDSTSTRLAERSFFVGIPYHSDIEASSPSEVSESVFSEYTGQSTESVWSSTQSTTSSSKMIQPLGRSSFVTRSTEVTISPRDKVVEPAVTIVHISASDIISREFQDSPMGSSPASETFDFPGKKAAELSPSTWHISPGSGRADHWKPPETWECPVHEEPRPTVVTKLSALGSFDLPFRSENEKPQKTSPPEMKHLLRSVRRMEAASDKIILERLKEEWDEVDDDELYREMELEKQLWMLSALKGFNRKLPKCLDGYANSNGPTKVLSLYENQASCSFLSALTSADEVHHLSTTPLNPKSYPNIHPLTTASPTAQLSYPPNTFNAIHAFNLTSVLPASSVPSILKECHRILAFPSSQLADPSSSTATLTPVPKAYSGAGTLHLTIIDPSPLPATLGPRLRAWLDDHLLLNLERQFRCINPARLLPGWLADAGLRIDETSSEKKWFLACVEPTVKNKLNTEVDGHPSDTNATKVQLRSTVGRMLWKEMWGPFVEGDTWWWEDESVVSECECLGTCWEYSIIEAVKEI